jgi:hypothetical protein
LSKTTAPTKATLHAGMEKELFKYQVWAQTNQVEEGGLDNITDILNISTSNILAKSIFISLREIIFTLGYIEDMLADPHQWIE